MAVPSELSLAEIRKFMLKNGGKVTNHELVKHFKSFLTNPNTKGEARKRFKTCVNILSTIKNENNEKYLILRKRYFNECPVEDEPEDDLHLLGNPEYLRSPGSRSGISEYDLAPSSSNISASSFGEMQMATSSEHIKSSPYKEPPPYKPPPKVMHHAYQNQQKYGDCVDEFKSALSAIGRRQNELATGGSFDDGETIGEVVADMIPKIPTQTKPSKDDQNLSTQLMRDNALELQPPSVPSIGSNALVDGTKHDVDEDKENVGELPAPKVMNPDHVRTLDKQISVKEATKKFNRIASEEEANKITSPPAKKKPEKPLDEVNNENLVSLTGHPKSKEWLVSSARANYQELAKLSAEHPELVRLQDPTTYFVSLDVFKSIQEETLKKCGGFSTQSINTGHEFGCGGINGDGPSSGYDTQSINTGHEFGCGGFNGGHSSSGYDTQSINTGHEFGCGGFNGDGSSSGYDTQSINTGHEFGCGGIKGDGPSSGHDTQSINTGHKFGCGGFNGNGPSSGVNTQSINTGHEFGCGGINGDGPSSGHDTQSINTGHEFACGGIKGDGPSSGYDTQSINTGHEFGCGGINGDGPSSGYDTQSINTGHEFGCGGINGDGPSSGYDTQSINTGHKFGCGGFNGDDSSSEYDTQSINTGHEFGCGGINGDGPSSGYDTQSINTGHEFGCGGINGDGPSSGYDTQSINTGHEFGCGGINGDGPSSGYDTQSINTGHKFGCGGFNGDDSSSEFNTQSIKTGHEFGCGGYNGNAPSSGFNTQSINKTPSNKVITLPSIQLDYVWRDLFCEAHVLDEQSKQYHFESLWEDAKQKTMDKVQTYERCNELENKEAIEKCQDLDAFAPYSVIIKFHEDLSKTALHWAAKHGNEDVVKLIAGTRKADVNARTNGGYTPLHLAMQFGKDNIFELLCNVYKADRDTLDWSGRKPLDYRKQSTSVSASTYSKIKARKKHSEKDLGFLRIGSLNVRVKKTTEAFSNFLGVGSNSNPNQHNNNSNMTNHRMIHARSSVPSSTFDKLHKSWGSADTIPPSKDSGNSMPPPKYNSVKKRRAKRAAEYFNATGRVGHRSVPTTPNQPRSHTIHSLSEHPQTESDSDTAGFDSNWK